jgi:hypothetical protein
MPAYQFSHSVTKILIIVILSIFMLTDHDRSGLNFSPAQLWWNTTENQIFLSSDLYITWTSILSQPNWTYVRVL